MATNRTRRQRVSTKPAVPPALIYYFQTGDEDQSQFPEEDRYNPFLIGFPLGKGRDVADLWLLVRDEVIADWKRKKRPGLPWAAKEFDE